MDITSYAIHAINDYNHRSSGLPDGELECPSCGRVFATCDPDRRGNSFESAEAIRAHALSCQALRSDIVGQD